MGKQIEESRGKIISPGAGPETGTETGTGAGTGGTVKNPGTGTAKDGRTGPGTGTGDSTDTKQNKTDMGLSEIIPSPEQKKIPKKRKKKKVTKEPSFNAEQITVLLSTISGIFATRPGLEMFALTPEESGQIAEPLAKILEKSESLANITQYSDGIALVTACIIIFMPKFIIFFAMNKNKKKERKIISGTDNEKRPDSRNDKPSNSQNTLPVKHDGKSIFASIPSIV